MKNGKPVIKSENVFTPELLVDPYDAYYGNPLCLYQQKFVTKDSLRNDPILSKNARESIKENSQAVTLSR